LVAGGTGNHPNLESVLLCSGQTDRIARETRSARIAEAPGAGAPAFARAAVRRANHVCNRYC